MKKFLIMMCLVALFAIGASAAETVLYQNDFSDPMSIFDFMTYRAVWDIRDGALYITDENVKQDTVDVDNYSHIIFYTSEAYENYIIEVDMLDVQTSAGVIFNSQLSYVSAKNSGFAGYVYAFANSAESMGIGAADTQGYWKGNLYSSAPTTNIYAGMDLHLVIIVKDGVIGVNAIDVATGDSVQSCTYTIGSKDLDPAYTDGTFGFRVKQLDTEGVASNVNTLHFDNLIVTTANETTVEEVVNKNVVPATPAEKIDTSNLLPIYTNTFDDASALDDFAQFYGTWEVNNGAVYLTDVGEAADALLIYNGIDALKYLKDYVLDIDMYNVQTQGGVIVRSQVDLIDGTMDGSDFRGYFALVGKAGDFAALSYTVKSGIWGNNFKVSNSGIFAPGDNIHIQLAVKGEIATVSFSDIDTGEHLWSCTQDISSYLWDQGSFGVRLSTKINANTGGDNVGTTHFDNLVISTYAEPCGDNATWSLDTVTGVLTISGTGAMWDYPDDDAPWRGDDRVKSLVVEEGITYIGQWAFHCIMATEFSLPSTLREIGMGGFAVFECSEDIENFVIPEGVTTLGDWALGGSTRLKSVVIPKSVVNFGENLFVANPGGDIFVTIHCYRGSAADEYAKANGIAVEYIVEDDVEGDLDGDGEVSVSDAIVVIDAILGGNATEDTDINGDGKVNLLDILSIIAKLVK